MGEGSPYQVLSHGLCPDIYGEAAQLRGVLKFTIEGSQVHWKDVVFRKGRFLQKKTRCSLAYHGPPRKTRDAEPCSLPAVTKEKAAPGLSEEENLHLFFSGQLNSNPAENTPLPWSGSRRLPSNPFLSTIHSSVNRTYWKTPT